MPIASASERPVAAAAPNFGKYSSVYDLLYRDKDYAGEADYVARMLRAAVPHVRDLLELGSGTGRHGRALAVHGLNVYGIERSSDMVAAANATGGPPQTAATGGSFRCEVGDVRAITFARSFDAVIALFHVISYQTTDSDLRLTFATAARHLKPGGVFLFDVWHGPAVLTQRPERRVKKVGDDKFDLVRTAHPHLDAGRRTVNVTYNFECRDRLSGQLMVFREDHLMRFLFADEVESLAMQTGMRLVASEEFMTGRAPSAATWSVAYILRK